MNLVFLKPKGEPSGAFKKNLCFYAIGTIEFLVKTKANIKPDDNHREEERK